MFNRNNYFLPHINTILFCSAMKKLAVQSSIIVPNEPTERKKKIHKVEPWF